jgi:hypothetical protein
VTIDAQLQELVDAPSERLDVELKTWIDLRDNGHRAQLAKAMLAIANHGGGFIVIGFTTEGSTADGRPPTLDGYSQDAVNDTVDRFAEPAFHCNVHYVRRTADGQSYPVIVVPGGHKMPVRCKRGSQGNEVHENRYYIRRPGPASEEAKTAHEWNELIGRCVKSRRDEVADILRDVLEGRPPRAAATPDAAARLEQWTTESMERRNAVLGAIPANAAARMPHGYYTVSAEIEGFATDLPKAQHAAQTAARTKHTGWTPWWWPTRDGIRPYVEGNVIECSIGAQNGDVTADHADFWRISPRGQLFIIRGYTEDNMRDRGIEPGMVVDLTLPVWRIGECLLYIARFAAAVDAEHASVLIRCRWIGLRGRRLTSLSARRAMFEERIARSNECSTSITTPADRITTALPEIVHELVEPLFILFDFFRPGNDFYTVELNRLQQERF